MDSLKQKNCCDRLANLLSSNIHIKHANEDNAYMTMEGLHSVKYCCNDETTALGRNVDVTIGSAACEALQCNVKFARVVYMYV
jgi:hypothetical protein